MIVVTRLNDSQFAINPDLIERINSNPDTTLVMVDGAKYIVTESMSVVIERIASYRARVIALAHTSSIKELPHGGRALGLVPQPNDGDEMGDARAPHALRSPSDELDAEAADTPTLPRML